MNESERKKQVARNKVDDVMVLSSFSLFCSGIFRESFLETLTLVLHT